MRTRDATKIAERIVNYLFNDGAQDADSLVLRMPNGRDSGGWGRESVIDVIVERLKVKPAPRKKGKRP